MWKNTIQDLTRINKKLSVSKREIVENWFFSNFFLIKKKYLINLTDRA